MDIMQLYNPNDVIRIGRVNEQIKPGNFRNLMIHFQVILVAN